MGATQGHTNAGENDAVSAEAPEFVLFVLSQWNKNKFRDEWWEAGVHQDPLSIEDAKVTEWYAMGDMVAVFVRGRFPNGSYRVQEFHVARHGETWRIFRHSESPF